MHSFSAMTKVQKEKKNTSPRTAPAMSCSRLKIRNPPPRQIFFPKIAKCMTREQYESCLKNCIMYKIDDCHR